MKILYYLISTIGNSIMETLIHYLTNFTNYIFINTTFWAQNGPKNKPKITFYNNSDLVSWKMICFSPYHYCWLHI